MSKEPRAKWLVRWIKSAPSRWFGKRSALGQDVAGGTHGLAYLRHLARGNRLRPPGDLGHQVDTEENTSPPVLLLHGFMGTRGSMFMLERRLLDDNFYVFSFNLGAINTHDIRSSAFRIHRKIESILAQTSVEEVDIIGHSMGGLIGLYYVKKLGGHKRVRKLILMGTPLRGTWVALAGVAMLGLRSASSWQLLPRSKFLDELHKGSLPKDVDMYTIAAARDWVCPPKSTKIRGAKAVVVPMGHAGLVVSGDVYGRIRNILRNPRKRDR